MEEINAYQPPQASSHHPSRPFSRYVVVAAPRGGFRQSAADALAKLLQDHGARGERLVAVCNESGDRMYFVFQTPEEVDAGKRALSYRVVRTPRAKSLSQTQAGKLTDFMAVHFPELDEGWVPIAQLSNRQLVLTRAADFPSELICGEYLLAHVPPVWWRTLVGSTYLRVISEELNTLATKGYEVVTYLGDDQYLLGKRSSDGEAAPVRYQLIFIGNLLRVIFQGYASACNKRIEQMSAHGWELVTCRYSELLFKKVGSSEK